MSLVGLSLPLFSIVLLDVSKVLGLQARGMEELEEKVQSVQHPQGRNSAVNSQNLLLLYLFPLHGIHCSRF